MIYGPLPDGISSWRSTKQLSSFLALCVATILSPWLFNIPTEVILAIISIYTMEHFLDEVRSYMTSFRDTSPISFALKTLFIITSQILPPTLIFRYFLDPLMKDGAEPQPEQLQDALSKAFQFNALYAMWFFKLVISIIPKSLLLLPSEQEKGNLFFTKKIKEDKNLDSIIENDAVHFAVKSGLPSLQLTITNAKESGACANLDRNEVTIRKSLDNAFRDRDRIDAVLAHEVGHLTKSTLDRFIHKCSLHLSSLFNILAVTVVPSAIHSPESLLRLIGSVLFTNFTFTTISQAEEERADRMACHILDSPDKALEIVSFLGDRPELKPSEKSDVANLFGKFLGFSTHPSNGYRLRAIEDEITKIEESPDRLAFK